MLRPLCKTPRVGGTRPPTGLTTMAFMSSSSRRSSPSILFLVNLSSLLRSNGDLTSGRPDLSIQFSPKGAFSSLSYVVSFLPSFLPRYHPVIIVVSAHSHVPGEFIDRTKSPRDRVRKTGKERERGKKRQRKRERDRTRKNLKGSELALFLSPTRVAIPFPHSPWTLFSCLFRFLFFFV